MSQSAVSVGLTVLTAPTVLVVSVVLGMLAVFVLSLGAAAMNCWD